MSDCAGEWPALHMSRLCHKTFAGHCCAVDVKP